MIEFFVPTAPQGKQSPRAVNLHGRARIIKAPKTKRYEDMISVVASQAMAGQPPIAEPVEIAITILMPVPESWSARKRAQALSGLLRPQVKPDCSNVLKAIEDGCNGVVFVDDKLITDGSFAKRYAATPGVQVRVWPAIPACMAMDRVAPQPESVEQSPQAALPVESDDPFAITA
ncbi:MAG: RusA family crossover junction endodeoxyribonuclease [Rhodospirillales bacterium]